ncbi:MAG: L,D-transpeptidase family protein, partial [Pseudomonadota bacterium]
MTRFLTAACLLLTNASLTASDFPVADFVLVDKSDRELHLMQNGEVFRSYPIALGIRPSGHKQREGDFRTPEGRYLLDRRNPDSEFFLSIRVSYPNPDDIRRAEARGEDPGGQIMIHGQPNIPTKSEAYYRTQ